MSAIAETEPPPDFVFVAFRPGGGSGGSGGGGGEVRCTWQRAQPDGFFSGSNVQGEAAKKYGIERIDSAGFAYRTDPNVGDELTFYYRSGPDCGSDFIWVPTSLTARSLIPALRARLEGVVDKPVPNMSPRPDAGTYMNLGIWLAVEDPGARSERVVEGPVWAAAEVTLTGFDVDFGNGHVESCEGIGVPIVNEDTCDEGPCGYTYAWPDERGEYEVSFTSHYRVTYSLSSGESGTLPVIDKTTTFPYHVYELQTVGVDN